MLELNQPRRRPFFRETFGTGLVKFTTREGVQMHPYTHAIVEFLKDEDGPTAVEYAVMLALIIVVCIGAITTLGKNANGVFSDVALNTAMTSSSSS